MSAIKMKGLLVALLQILLCSTVLGLGHGQRSPIPHQIKILDHSSNGQLEIKLNTIDQKSVYKKGDRIQYSVTSNADCYISLISFQSDGTWVMLFPNRYESEILLPANTPKTIPDQGDRNYDFIVDAPYGKDTICVIASSTQTALTLKLEALTSNNPQYVSMDRGVFPVHRMGEQNPTGMTLWDIDWIQLETTETLPLQRALILSKPTAWLTIAIGLAFTLCGGMLWRRSLS